MKAKFLKIAGVKSEQEFYRKFPTEEAFMKAHGKELKKAQWGVAQMAAKSLQELGNKFTNPVAIDPVQTLQQANISAPTVNQLPNAGVPFEPMSQTNMVNWNYNQPPQVMNPNSPQATMIRDRQEFESYSNILDDYNKSMMPKQNATSQKENKKNPLSKAMNTAGELVQGIQQLREEKRARLRAEQAKGVSDVALQASRTRDVDANRGRRYVRPEDQRLTGEEMFPIYGVGTNVLTAKDGVEASSKGGVPILSLVDYMKASGRDSSMKARKELASRVGLKNYTGKEDENRSLLKNLMNEDEIVRSIYETDRIVNPETGKVDFEETQVYEEPIEVQQSRVANIRKAYKELQDDVLSRAVKKSIDRTKGVQPVANTTTYKGPTENEDFFTFTNRVYRGANPSAPIIDSRPDDRKLNRFEVMQNKLDAGAYDPYAASMFLRDNPNNPLNALLAFGVHSAGEWPLRLGISAGKLFTGKGEARDAVTLGALGVGPAIGKLASKLPAFGRLVRMKSLNPMSRNVGNPMFEELTLENIFSGVNKHMPSVKKVAAQYKYDMNRLAQAVKTDKKVAKLLQDAVEEEEILMGVGTKMKPGTMPFDKFNKRAQQNLNDLYERNYRSGGEIANTFAPNTLYTDLDEKGKEMPRAFTGLEIAALKSLGGKTAIGGKAAKFLGADGNITFNDLGDAGVADFASNMMTSIGGENAGGNIGRTIGKQFGPAGQLAGEVLGRMLNTNPKRTRRAQEATLQNLGATTLNTAMQRNQIQNNAFMEDGGKVSPYEWVSHTWQPQKIVSFGEHKMSDLLRPDETMDTLRAGGHLKDYTPPSEEAMYTGKMAMGGELQTHWGGYAEPMSYNPYMPGGGETVMFRGQSHDESDGKGNTGIGITYGENPVEVERGEPMFEMEEGGQIDPMTGEPQKSGVVLGNIKITSALANMLEDPKAKGKKFKTYGAELSKKENKINKQMEKAIDKINNNDDSSPFGRIADATWNTYIIGGNDYLKDYAKKKMNAAALQSAIHDTKEEDLLKITDKGIISAKQGIQIAQDGEKLPTLNDSDYDYLVKLYNEAEKQKTGPAVLKFQKEYHRLAPEYAKSVIGKYPVTAYGKEKGLTALERESNEDSIFGKRTKQYMAALQKTAPKRKPEELIPIPKRPLPTVKTPDILTKGPMELKAPAGEPKKDNVPFLENIFNQALPFLRPSDAEPLDPSQLYGEMYALATNQLEPVRAQSFQPELGVPYDISLQDILNENEASYRAQQRMVGYNPAAQAILNSQKYQANQKVLGEQFRMNQAMKDRVYAENRSLLNQAKLQNLATYDQQYVRQEEAKSKTKATTQAALDSIASKFAQNKLENRTLQVYENQYNYRYDPRFRAINMNPLDPFNISGLTPVTDEEGNVVQYVKKTEKKDKYGRPEGSSTTVTSKKKSNGGIVRDLKSI